MTTYTVDQIIETRIRGWFPTLDVGAAVDISRLRKDLEALAAGVKAELLQEGQVTREKLIAEIEKLPRYEPELRKGEGASDAKSGLVEMMCEATVAWNPKTKPGTGRMAHLAERVLTDARLPAAAGYEAAMVAIDAGQPASFVSIQDLRRAVNG